MRAGRAKVLACLALAAGCSRRQIVIPDARIRIDAPLEIKLASSILTAAAQYAGAC